MTDAQVTEGNFLELLLAAVPEVGPVVDEHLADQDGELLMHLLMPDLLRFATSAFGAGNLAMSAKLLNFVGTAFENADARVDNAIAVSFVEHVGGSPGETPEFIATWPRSLLNERDRQLNWRPL
ncbi:MAG: vanillate demethylase subunit, partial [Schumannella sp.]|nr:vanillate demethylase subunit [Schumannella sp.]